MSTDFDPNAEFAHDNQTQKKRALSALVIDTITDRCPSSTHKIFQDISVANTEPRTDRKIKAIILTGGLTNFSYKVFVDGHPELCLFAKLSFEFALWNPDKNEHYDLVRTDNEYEIMETMHIKMPDNVVAPLANNRGNC